MANYRAQKASKASAITKLLLVLVALAIIIFSANYVIKTKNSTDHLLASTNSETSQITPLKSHLPDISTTDSWTLFSNQEGAFTLKYPPQWFLAPSSKLCPSGTFDRSIYLAADSSSLIKCPKVLQSQIFVTSLVGDQVSKYNLSAPNYQNVKQVPVKINGTDGVKETADTSIGLPPNTFIERYLVFNGTNTYLAQYLHAQGAKSYSKNVASQFDQMVIQTLSLHN